MGKIKFDKKFFVTSAVFLGLVLISAFGTYFVFDFFWGNREKAEPSNKQENQDNKDNKKEEPVSYPYTLTSYKGAVFGAKVPQGWNITSNESGIDIIHPENSNIGASGVVAVGWYGYQTPDGFISFMLQAIGGYGVNYENQSSEETIKDPNSSLNWVMKTKTFTFYKNGIKLKAKASAGVLNGYGQFMGMLVAFQTTPETWGQWAPTLERVAQSITIIDPSKAGGIDKVRLPTAADLANDSSPLMEAWEYKNKSQERTSHEFSDAIMGQESGLYSPSTGRSYTLPLTFYDPTVGGYRNPDNSSEILQDFYK